MSQEIAECFDMNASELLRLLPTALGVSVVVTIFVVLLLLRFRSYLPLDRPNHRSLHVQPVPRTGGIAILAGTLAGIAVVAPGSLAELVGLAFCIGMVSLWDDVRNISVRVRFLAQFIATSLLVWIYIRDDGSLVVAVICILSIVWLTNVFNFMDGSDGLASGMGLFGFGAYAVAAWHAGALDIAVISIALAGGNLGFLIFNFHPARMFMGDVGSVPLGYLAGGLGFIGWQSGAWPLGFPVVVFSPFLMDATVTLVKRIFAGERAWQAHRDHYFQRLILMGFGHRNTAILEYVVMLGAAVTGWLILLEPDVLEGMFVLWVAIYGVLFGIVEVIWRRNDRPSSANHG